MQCIKLEVIFIFTLSINWLVAFFFLPKSIIAFQSKALTLPTLPNEMTHSALNLGKKKPILDIIHKIFFDAALLIQQPSLSQFAPKKKFQRSTEVFLRESPTIKDAT